MKLKVLKKFHDKETGELRKVGEIIEVSDKRATEILKSPLRVADVEEVGEPDNKGEGENPSEPPEVPENPPAGEGENPSEPPAETEQEKPKKGNKHNK